MREKKKGGSLRYTVRGDSEGCFDQRMRDEGERGWANEGGLDGESKRAREKCLSSKSSDGGRVWTEKEDRKSHHQDVAGYLCLCL